ncbi:MAG: hypothetical protein HY812_06360 [Planctomycetes bacterium]|nr:hypothetical protein [Planctomycetota bacterium]
MNVSLCAFLIALASTAATDLKPDRVALLRVNQAQKGEPLSLWMYKSDGPAADFCGAFCLSDTKLPKTQGKRPVRHHFPADFDGDGVDELLLVRERVDASDHGLQLRVYRMPDYIWGDTGKALLSTKKNDLGSAAGDLRVLLIGAVDADGSGADELLIVRERTSGEQVLEIRRLPPDKSEPMGPPIRSDQTFGQAALDANVAIAGADLQGDGAEEVVVIRRAQGGKESLLVFQPPAAPCGETGAPLASYDDVTAPAGWSNVALGRIRMEENKPERVVFTQATAAGATRILVYPLPSSVAQQLPAPSSFDETPGHHGPERPLVAAFGFRDNPEPLPSQPSLNGAFKLAFTFPILTGDDLSWTGTIGPFHGATAQLVGGTNWTLTMDGTGTVLQGTLKGGLKSGSTITFPSPTISYKVTQPSEIAAVGDVIVITYAKATLSIDGTGIVTLTEDVAGPPGTSELRDASGTVKRQVSAYSFKNDK